MDQFNSNELDAKYLVSTVGSALSLGLAEVVELRPEDPIEHLAKFLYQHGENVRRRDDRKLVEGKKFALSRKKIEISILDEKSSTNFDEQIEKRRNSRRKFSMTVMQRILSAVSEETDERNSVEIDEFEILRQAAQREGNFAKFLTENPIFLATRNSQGQTARDVAESANIQENVDIIDNFCKEIFRENRRSLVEDLFLRGFRFENVDPSINFDLWRRLIELRNSINDLHRSIMRGDIGRVAKILKYHRPVPIYRNEKGSTPAHHAIEARKFEICALLLERFPTLKSAKDLRERTIFDILKTIKKSELKDDENFFYENIEAKLNDS